jgi:hypothetical protein
MSGGNLSLQISKGLGWVVVNAVALLFFRRSDQANERMDRYHRELLELKGLDTLLAACDDLSDEGKEKCKRNVIETASSRWLGLQRVVKRRSSSTKPVVS